MTQTIRALTFKQIREMSIDLRVYAWDPLPDGTWVGRLDHKLWGSAPAGLLNCFFTCQEAGRQFKLSAFALRGVPDKHNWYSPRSQRIDVSHEPLHRLYRLTTGVGPRGKPAWFDAEPIDDGGGP